MSQLVDREKRFDWPLCYEAESFVAEKLQLFLDRDRFAHSLSERMLRETGTLFLDWVDYLTIPPDEAGKLQEVGFVPDPTAEAADNVFWHPAAMLPRVMVRPETSRVVALRVDSIESFRQAHDLQGGIEGAPFAKFRRFTASGSDGARLEVIERRGYRGYVPELKFDASARDEAKRLWSNRLRTFKTDTEGFEQAHGLLKELVASVGRDLACAIVFEEERAYWQSRNRAGQVQKARQDALGLGWANHDHHTFRSSREHFIDLMRVLEELGFERRERYYAGAQAGWGAQILEQPIEGLVAFCDVDLEPHETEIDFSRQKLPASARLGTIGLWVGLHGESFLEAGMHHLECRFDYDLLREQLSGLNVNTMKPFSDFPFLKQAFTEGERWGVRKERLERLRQMNLIDAKQFEQFAREGAIGSHLENLQRKAGFKGFNQKSVSVIIQATDPRLQPAATH
jgi:hypothetical protein